MTNFHVELRVLIVNNNDLESFTARLPDFLKRWSVKESVVPDLKITMGMQ